MEQGTKIRAIDNMSWSARDGRKRTRGEMKVQSVNGHSAVPEKMKHDHLDDLDEYARLFREHLNEVGRV